jgi:hypothetical protein
VAGELAFVYHSFVRQGSDVETDGVLAYGIVDQVAGIVPQYKEFAFKHQGVRHVIRAGDENLFHFRFYGKGRGADAGRVYGNLAPGEDLHSQFLGSTDKNVPALFPQLQFLREEDHTHGILAIGRQMYSQLQALLEEEFMGNLDLDTGTVACVGFTTTGSAMFHILQDGEGIRDDLVALITLDIGYKSNSARIVLKLWAIQSLVACHLHEAVFRNKLIKRGFLWTDSNIQDKQ